MGSFRDDAKRPFVTGFKYDLRDRKDSLTYEDFERINEAVMEWSRQENIPCETVKTRTGFAVSFSHALENGDAFGLRLYLHLSAGIFRELEDQAR